METNIDINSGYVVLSKYGIHIITSFNMGMDHMKYYSFYGNKCDKYFHYIKNIGNQDFDIYVQVITKNGGNDL